MALLTAKLYAGQNGHTIEFPAVERRGVGRERKKGHRTKRHPLFHRSPSDSPSNLAEFDPEPDSLRIIQVEHGDGGSADGGWPDKDESHPFEVALPALPAGAIWMEAKPGAYKTVQALCVPRGRHGITRMRLPDTRFAGTIDGSSP